MDNIIAVPKIKKTELISKVMIDPADISKGLPISTLPLLTDSAIVVSLLPHKAPLARLTPDGTLKLSLKYTA